MNQPGEHGTGIRRLSAEDLYAEKVRRARRQSPEEKLLAGPRLFERSCRVMLDGIRDQFPEATEEEVQRILRERLAIARRLERGS